MQNDSSRKLKALGRKVANFDNDKWNLNKFNIVKAGNYYKFNQNSDLYQILLDTHNALLFEASPYDKIWGIGLDEATAKITPIENWPGEN